jgi:hypothetical protein
VVRMEGDLAGDGGAALVRPDIKFAR